MNKTEVHCALCNILIESVKFNLKNNNSKYSNTPLLSLIENVAGKFLTQHFDICMQCYDLLNELDAIELRQMEIKSQFKKYVEHHSKQSISHSLKEPPQNINGVVKEINNITPLSNSDIVENNITTEFLNKTSADLKGDVKFIDKSIMDTPLNVSNIKEVMSISNTEKTDKPVIQKSGKWKKNGVPKPHKCHCFKEFRTAGELKNHMNTHSNHRAFICEICGQSYKHKAAFNIHMDMHNGINPFTCIYCNKSFTQKGALVRHVPIHTG